MSETMHDERAALAACFRLLAHYGWDDLISTHASARLANGHFLINRRGDLFREITASRLVEVDLDGRVVSPRGATVNAAGFTIHSAIHAARAHIGCVIHLHARNGVAVSMLRGGLAPLSQKALLFDGRLAYHDYEGIALDHDERARLIADLGDHRAMILRNHGTLAVGRTVPEAFAVMYALETACELQILAQSTGQPLAEPSERARAKVREQAPDLGAFMHAYAETAWPALLRFLDETSPGYRD
jgi:ribulose-5-phosphate 4-epimerase/fuculose-1-phosphate aldolase